jgi:hypothetical protein
MAGELCRLATCGGCGRCDAEPDYFRFHCLWCGDETEVIYERSHEGYHPYCSSQCALYAESESTEDWVMEDVSC